MFVLNIAHLKFFFPELYQYNDFYWIFSYPLISQRLFTFQLRMERTLTLEEVQRNKKK